MAAPASWVEGGPCTEDVVAQLDFASDLIMAIRAGADDFLKEVAVAGTARHAWTDKGKHWGGDHVGSTPVRDVEAAASAVRGNLSILQTTWRRLAGVLPPPPTPKPAAGVSSDQGNACSLPAVVNSQELLQLRQRQRFMPPSQPDECALQATWQRWSAAITSYTIQNRCQAALSLLSAASSPSVGTNKKRRVDYDVGGARESADRGLALWMTLSRVQAVAPKSVSIELYREPHCPCVLPTTDGAASSVELVASPVSRDIESAAPLDKEKTSAEDAVGVVTKKEGSGLPLKGSSAIPPSPAPRSVAKQPQGATKDSLIAMAATTRCIRVRIAGVLCAMVALAEPGSSLPVAVALFACEEEEGGSPWGDSQHTVFRQLSTVAMDALTFFRVSMERMRGAKSLRCSPGWALEQLLLWLLAHEELFSRPCAACGSVLALDRALGTLLPPLLRPYYGIMKDHSDCSGGMPEAAHAPGAPATPGAQALALTAGSSQQHSSVDAPNSKQPMSGGGGAIQKPAYLQGNLTAFPAYLRIPPFHAQCFAA